MVVQISDQVPRRVTKREAIIKALAELSHKFPRIPIMQLLSEVLGPRGIGIHDVTNEEMERALKIYRATHTNEVTE